MPSLKDLKNRIKSVKSTQKITKAMKMVAAAKLRRAREAAEAARPYAEAMERMLASLAASVPEGAEAPLLLRGRRKTAEYVGNDGGKVAFISNVGDPSNFGNPIYCLIVATSDRGLCGAFNSSIVRATRRKVRELQAKGLTVKLLFVGRKGYEQLHYEFADLVIGRVDAKSRKLGYADAEAVSQVVMEK